MNREILADQIDRDIQSLISGKSSDDFDHPLVSIAASLSCLASDEFRERLRQELLERADDLQAVMECNPAGLSNPQIMPTLAEQRFTALPADPRSFVFSFLSHAAAVILIASGIWMGGTRIIKTTETAHNLNYIPMPLGNETPHGGGGGGDRSRIEASRGTPPKFSNQQLTPPIVVRSESAKLQVAPTILGPPQIKLPQSDRIGDLTSSNVVMPSNGSGSRSGVGSGAGTGIGSGDGAGFGPGSEAGMGGAAFRPGNGVTAPRAIYDPDPEYSEEARKAKYQGTVILSLIVDPSGRAKNIQIARSLGMGLDEKAIDAVAKWQFAPGMKDGHAVAVRVNVEVNFRLY